MYNFQIVISMNIPWTAGKNYTNKRLNFTLHRRTTVIPAKHEYHEISRIVEPRQTKADTKCEDELKHSRSGWRTLAKRIGCESPSRWNNKNRKKRERFMFLACLLACVHLARVHRQTRARHAPEENQIERCSIKSRTGIRPTGVMIAHFNRRANDACCPIENSATPL